MLWLEYILYALYLLLGPAAWIVFAVTARKGRKRMLQVQRYASPDPVPAPRATILIPAKDEGQRIADCLTSAVKQDYPNFHVIAINDRSSDQTGRVMDELARQYPNLTVKHIQEGSLPAGWTGKCNALHSAVKQAQGQWLLFVDSDVVLQPDALRSTLTFAEDKQCDLVSLFPRLENHTFWEGLLVPLCGSAVSSMYLVPLTNNNHLPHVAFANGQYLMMRTSVYQAIGGHEAVRDRFCEDVELARLLKSQGYKVRISWGTEYAAVRMYSSLSSIIRGWSRSYYAAGLGKPWRIIQAMLFVLLCGYSAYAAIGWSVYRLINPGQIYGGGIGWLITSLLHLLIMTGVLGVMYTWTGNRAAYAACFPLGGAMLMATLFKGAWICLTKKVVWRGTTYRHTMRAN